MKHIIRNIFLVSACIGFHASYAGHSADIHTKTIEIYNASNETAVVRTNAEDSNPVEPFKEVVLPPHQRGKILINASVKAGTVPYTKFTVNGTTQSQVLIDKHRKPKLYVEEDNTVIVKYEIK